MSKTSQLGVVTPPTIKPFQLIHDRMSADYQRSSPQLTVSVHPSYSWTFTNLAFRALEGTPQMEI